MTAPIKPMNWTKYRTKLKIAAAAVEQAKLAAAELETFLDAPCSFNGRGHFAAKAALQHVKDAGRFLDEMVTHA